MTFLLSDRALMFFVLIETVVLHCQEGVRWVVPVVVVVSIVLGGFSGLLYAVVALVLGYRFLHVHRGNRRFSLWQHGSVYRYITYQDWLLWALLLVLLGVLYYFANDVIPETGFPVGRIRALSGFLALAAIAFYVGRTEEVVKRLWTDIYYYDKLHLYWAVTVTFYTILPHASFPWNLVIVAAATLLLLFIQSLLYKIDWS